MNSLLRPWLESLVVLGIGAAAFLLGRWCSGLPKRYWMIGYFLPLSLLLLYFLAMFDPRIALTPPISWMLMGRARFASFNFVAVVMLAVPLFRLPNKRSRLVVSVLVVVLTLLSALPFVAPAFNRSHLAGLKTRIDADGVCHQSNDYTCGPAAAVTALRKLGFTAEEGELAILAHTSSIAGTEPDVLAAELRKRYGPEGLVAEYRSFRDVEELRKAGLTVAVVKFNALQDHCVAVLGVETNHVIVGDPLTGMSLITTKEFENKWLFCGIALKRVGR
jgi:hypothetical protein